MCYNVSGVPAIPCTWVTVSTSLLEPPTYTPAVATTGATTTIREPSYRRVSFAHTTNQANLLIA